MMTPELLDLLFRGMVDQVEGGRSAIDRGLSLLRSPATLGWWDLRRPGAVTSVTTQTTAPVTSWTKSAGITVTSGIADPDGGTGAYRVSVAATGNQYLRGPSDANRFSGFSRTTMRIRVHEHAGVSALYWMQHPYGASRLNVVRPSDESATRTDNTVYVSNGVPNYGVQWSDVGAGWRYVEFDELCAHVNAATVRQQPALHVSAPDAAARDLFDVYQITHVQQRVSAVADRRGGTVLTQATNDARNTIVPGGWLGRDCAIGCVDGGSSATAARAVGAGAWLVAGVVQPLRPEFATAADPVVTLTGSAAAVSLTITGGTAAARATYTWSWTDDAGTTTTGSFGGTLPAVPVAVALVYTGSALRLFIDGVRVGTDQAVSGTATITGINVRGQASEVAWTAWAVRIGSHSDQQVRDISLALRSEAGLPAMWRLVLKTGQSNETDTHSPEDRANVGRRLVLGQALSRRGLDGGSALSYAPWYPATSGYWWAYQDKRQAWSGSGQAFALAALGEENYGFCVLSMGKGGEAIAAWQAGGAMRTHTETHWPLAVADLGTSLARLEGIIWNQGEADTTSPAGYQAKLADVISWLRTLGGSPGAWVVVQRLNSNFSGDPDDVASIIAQQTAFVAADGNAYLAEADFAAPQYDGIHYARWGLAVMGANQYRALAGLAPLTP